MSFKSCRDQELIDEQFLDFSEVNQTFSKPQPKGAESPIFFDHQDDSFGNIPSPIKSKSKIITVEHIIENS